MIDPKGVSDKIKDRIDQIDRPNMIRPALDGKTITAKFLMVQYPLIVIVSRSQS